ncbi:DUF2183 domain-containing protein [Candidatus Ozemobacteraceae bacterium]|nr:DUF2183 domain-containing protein [Candidatus Ozemobacteraceae bacterium]
MKLWKSQSLPAAVALAVLAVLFAAVQAFCLDCPSLRLLPGTGIGEIRAEGLVRVGRPRVGTNRRDRLRGLLSRPAASATVVVSVGSCSRSVSLDERGAFGIDFPTPVGSGAIPLVVTDPDGDVLLRRIEQPLPASPSLLVVSDIDDTVMVSEVPEKRKLLFNSLFRTLKHRQTVPGTKEIYSELYRSLGPCALFAYLSASPAAMERFIGGFLAEHHFPPGLLITGDGVSYTKQKTFAHKMRWLQRLATLFPGTPMLLIGDTGEQDPEIYSCFASERVARISGIVLRRIGRFDGMRETRVREQCAVTGVPLLIWSEPDEVRAGLATMGFRIP